MSMWETPETPETLAGPAGGDDIALTTPVSAAAPSPGAAAGDTCPTCGGAPGPGKTGRCAGCVEEEWATLRSEMAHYNDSCENGPLGLLPAQLSYRPGFWRDNTLH